jgi:5S rRNA maturation endonuclease (ribonuclease M5)
MESKDVIKNHFRGKYDQFYARYLETPPKRLGQNNEYRTNCPFHKDDTPSFDINADTGLYFCHGCPANGHAFDFYAKTKALDIRRDFPKILKGIAGDFSIPLDDIQPRFVEAYDYTDETGNLLFQVCRYEPKAFRQRRKDAGGKWVYSLNGVRRVLYNLPQVLKVQKICVVEGERDVETLRTMGFTATTSPNGACKWKPEYSESLRDKDVSLIPDNDQPGREHMDLIASELRGIAKSIKLVTLPDLPDKGDVSDWVQQFKDNAEAAERLSVMIEEAKPYEPHTEESTNSSESSSDDLEFPPVMSGVAGDFANTYASVLEAPAHFFYLSYLTCLGNYLSGKATILSETRQQPRLYTLLLGESGDTRKSTAISKTIEFFQYALEGREPLNLCHGAGSAEGLSKRLNKIKEAQQKHPNCVLCLDEFSSFVGKCTIQSSILLPCVNTLFENNCFQNETKNDSAEIENGHLSLLAASTVQTYERTWHPSFTAIGFNNRLFLVPGAGQRKFPFPQPIPETLKRELKNRLLKQLIIVGDRVELPMTDEARKLYSAWYLTGMEKSIHATRLSTYAMRFMILLAINEEKGEIDTDIVNKSIKLCDWQLAVRKLRDPIDADNAIARMEEKIRRHLKQKKKLSRRQFRQLIPEVKTMGTWAFETALDNLERAEEIKPEKTHRTLYWAWKEDDDSEGPNPQV